MNGNKFIGLRIRLADRGCTNSARQSIPRAPDSVVEDACMAINSWGSE